MSNVMKVLVAEDNVINRAVAKGMLQMLKCEVDIAVDGLEAVAASAMKQYNMILMDCHMPEMDGITATTCIREREKAANALRVPIIALTANMAPGSREACIAAGMDDYMTKPVVRAELEQMIQRWATRPSASEISPTC
jgi:CheY-like chemotaxis protein